MTKILITFPSLVLNEKSKSLINLLNIIDYETTKVDLLVLESSPLLTSINHNVRILYYKDYLLEPFKLFYKEKSHLFVTSLYDKDRFAFHKHYDIAIAYDGEDNYLDMIVASVKASKKIIYVHNTLTSNKTSIKLLGKKYRYFNQIVCISSYLKFDLDTLYPTYKDKIAVTNYLLDEDIVSLAKTKTSIKLGKEYNIVVSAKVMEFLDIHKKLIDNGYNIKTYVIGDENTYEVSRYIQKLHLNSSVVILGELKNKYNVIKQADLIINMDESEYVLLEAMALNIPFVSVINSLSREIGDIMPKNAGIICSDSELYNSIVTSIKKWQKTINFDIYAYNDKVMDKLGKLLR